MKNLKSNITVGCIAAFLFTTVTQAQQSNVSSMVRSLSGTRSISSAPVQKRSVSVSKSSVKPKGYASSKTKSSSSYRSSSSRRSSSSYSSSSKRSYSPPPANKICYHVDPTAQLTTNRIQFRKNSTEIEHHSYGYLYDLANALMSHQLCNHRFVIEGHASAEGSYYTNQSLSQRRANAIFDFLVSRGVHPARLLSVGHGEEQAQYSASAPEYLRASDRRVMVFKLID